MTSPEQYDYRHPTLTADLVMKGGITSGVVYPHAACELAQTYRFRNVGGTSAGAIAAALTAAAEYGRESDGFTKLARLPEWLGHDGHLFGTFQPQRNTRRLFAVFTAGIGRKHRITRVVLSAVRQYPLTAAACSAPGVLATWLAASDGGGARLAAPALMAFGGALGGVGGSLYWATTRSLPKNFFGLCTGMEGHRKAGQPALTPWLTEQIDDIAGRAPAGRPLTFGDLDRADVNLEMVTTSLSNGRPFRLPFRERRFFFDPSEMRRLFPDRVVAWMESCPADLEADVEAGEDDIEYAELVRRLVPRHFRPMPARENLPVVVATRMSLSFPGLMSAVPLWAVDATRKHNRAAEMAWKRWLKTHRGQWLESQVDPRTLPDAPGQGPQPEHCWFSDGGIVSNFPVHFFDSPLPRHPTFAINLRPFPPDKEKSCNERDNVWIPPTEKAGTRDWWYPRWGTKGRHPLIGFGRAIVDTMQNWSDNAQIRVPGYSDRVVHINHTKEEGGININMPEEDVTALAERGRWAGVVLTERFSQRHEREPSWDSHRWLRFRSSLALVEEMLEKMGTSWRAEPPSVETSYPLLLQRALHDPPPFYHWADERQRAQAIFGTELLLRLINSWNDDENGVFGPGAPHPGPQLRIMPHW